MRKDKEQATVLRKSGMAYAEIKERLGVPKATLSGWFKDQKWSNDIALETVKKARQGGMMRLVVLNTIRGPRLRKVYEDAAQDAYADYQDLKFHPLFIAGVMAYLSSGEKTTRSRISFSNSDARLIKIFNTFLLDLCALKKVKYHLILREDQIETESLAYWIGNNGLKQEFFGKTIRIKGKSTKNGKKHGVCTISVNSAYLKSKILKWIELLSKEIGEETYLAGIV